MRYITRVYLLVRLSRDCTDSIAIYGGIPLSKYHIEIFPVIRTDFYR